jgi:hypothetical protein
VIWSAGCVCLTVNSCQRIRSNHLAAFLWVYFWVVRRGVSGLEDLEDVVIALTGQVNFSDKVVDVQSGNEDCPEQRCMVSGLSYGEGAFPLVILERVVAPMAVEGGSTCRRWTTRPKMKRSDSVLTAWRVVLPPSWGSGVAPRRKVGGWGLL